MDITTLREIATVMSFITFIGIIFCITIRQSVESRMKSRFDICQWPLAHKVIHTICG